MLKTKKLSILLILIVSLFILSACSSKDKDDSENDTEKDPQEYTVDDAADLVLEVVLNDFSEIEKDAIGVRYEEDVTVDGSMCYTFCAYEKTGEADVTLNFYAVKKDGSQWYRYDIENDEYSVGAQG